MARHAQPIRGPPPPSTRARTWARGTSSAPSRPRATPPPSSSSSPSSAWSSTWSARRSTSARHAAGHRQHLAPRPHAPVPLRHARAHGHLRHLLQGRLRAQRRRHVEPPAVLLLRAHRRPRRAHRLQAAPAAYHCRRLRERRGVIAAISDVYTEQEKAAKEEWARAVVVQLQEALRWGEEARVKSMRRRAARAAAWLPALVCCGRGCSRGKEGLAVVLGRLCLCGRDGRRRLAASLASVTGTGAGTASNALTLAILFVLRPTAQLAGCCKRRGGGGGRTRG